MDWILENFQVLIALGAGVAYWINKIREEREARRQEEDAAAEDAGWEYEGYDPEDYEEEEAYEEEEEEAIAVPPPMPQIIIYPSAPPPLPPKIDPVVERQREMMERLKALRAERAAAAQKHTPKAARTKTEGSNRGLGSRLQDKSEIRRAIVLREILGPPAGLK